MFKIVDATIGKLFAETANLLFSLVAWITAQVGYLLDYVIENLVLNMADMVNDIGAIDSLWQIFRDLGNIVFIGVLLYIAIRTILNVGNSFNTKRTLVRLVIVALLVNFSLFATKAVIDTSNVVALQFYNSIQVEDCGEGESECNISHFFADATNITSVQSAESINNETAVEQASSANFKITLARVLGTIFMLVTGFVMGAMAFLLIVRFGFLVLLMIASPLAFIAFVLPSANSWGNKWLDQLLSQSFFAPALFAMLYVVAALAADLQSGISDGNTDLMGAILDPEGDNMGVILMFLLMTFLMFYSLVVAKKIGASGASKTIKVGQQARNWGQSKVVGGTMRSTIGKVGQAADKRFKKSRLAQTYYGGKLREQTTKKAANAKFGTSTSAASIAKEKKKAESRTSSYDERQRVKTEIDQLEDRVKEGDLSRAEANAKKQRALSNLSSNEKIDMGKDFLRNHADVLTQSDIKAIENKDKFSERDKQGIKEAMSAPLKELLEEVEDKDVGDLNDDEVGLIKSFLGSRSDDQLKNLDLDIVTNKHVASNLSSSQVDTITKNKSKEEKDAIVEGFIEPLEKAAKGEGDKSVAELLEGKKKKDIVKLLKLADSNMRIEGEVVDHISKDIFEDLTGELKQGEVEDLRNAIIERATTADSASDMNERTAEWLMYGTGRAT